ncbi:1,4-beta-xylanase [Phenylobacterium deserti]|uniref:Endo-1,4-beta-xylanase n=1 Tax=Phenylobacterium deserti TaxID=1914756 RepID=A0A328A8R0_9CAUL|nr:1,4-beta-xylanase [Phenylobacterium deserti]
MWLKSFAFGLSCAALASSAGAQAPRQVCSNATGHHDGFYFTFWKDGGDACMTLAPKGRYSTRYHLVPRKNLVVGKGWEVGSKERRLGYRATFEPGANSYLTLYGWSVDPLVEYYVVDSWGSAFKPPGESAPVLGTVESDGGTYQIYRTTRVEKPSILGTQTFTQFWSVRTERRPQGADAAITFSNHVRAWERLGMRLGTMNYQVMATEGFGSTGRSEVTVWEQPR